MKELIRSFVAVEISNEARQQLADLLRRLQCEPGAPVRWVRPEAMHLTLAFLGEVDADLLASAGTRLVEVVRQHPAFTARLKGLGAFPSQARARVVWAGMEQGKDPVCALRADVVKTLRSVGYEPEKRPFSPHLTLGRLRVPGDVGRVVATQFESGAFAVERVVLFRSVLQPSGPVYSALAQFPLAIQPA
jgi:RNA 2',3'-cyclic 3'-phosphodiesterase